MSIRANPKPEPEPEPCRVQVVLWAFKPQLTRHYERLVGGGLIDASDEGPGAAPAEAAAAAPTTPLARSGNGVALLPCEAFLRDLGARKIIRERTLRPLSGVAGTRLPPVLLGLSLLDAKAAFFTALDFERHGQETLTLTLTLTLTQTQTQTPTLTLIRCVRAWTPRALST